MESSIQVDQLIEGAPQNEEFECKECHMTFKREASLAAHFDSIHEIKRLSVYCCSECKYKTGHLSHFKKHLEKHENSEEILQNASNMFYFTCDQCGKQFRQANKLHEHIAVDHEGRLPYACDICDAEFKSLSSYKKHNARHNGEKKSICHVCGVAFEKQIDMFRHIRENHPKPHTCDICGESFKRKENLRQHKLTHSSPKIERKTFICPAEGCKATFTRASNLKTHVKSIHGGVQPFTCEICGKSFLYPSLLEDHKQRHEKKPEPEIMTLGDDFFENVDL